MNTDMRKKIIIEEARRLMHLHYCYNDTEGVISCFAPQFSWFGAGENQYAFNYDDAVSFFRRFQGQIPKCNLFDEQYEVLNASEDVDVCSGIMWVATAPEEEMYVKVHQRMTFVFQWNNGKPLCMHMHCSNPYMELLDDELFPDKIGRQSFEYVQENMRRLEKEMRQKNSQMEVIMSSIPGGMSVCRADGNYMFLYVSPELAHLLGYTTDEFLQMSEGTGIGAIYPPDREKALLTLQEALSRGEQYSLKYRIPCKDGSLKWILDSGRKSTNEKGEAIINALYLDITKDEMDAEKLLRQKELLDNIYDTVPCGIIRFYRNNDSFELISANKTAASLLGYKDVYEYFSNWKNNFTACIPLEDRLALQEAYESLRKPGDKQNLSFRLLGEPGNTRWINGIYTLVSKTGEALVMQLIFFDVTKRHNLEEQLYREQEMYRLAMESSSDVMFEYILEEDTLVTYQPRAHCDGKDSVVRYKISDFQSFIVKENFVHPQDIPNIIDNICNGRCEIFEARFHTADISKPRDYQWHRITSKTIYHGNTPYRIVGTIHNIHRDKLMLNSNKKELYMSRSALQAISGGYSSIYYVDLVSGQYYGVRLPRLEYRWFLQREGDIWKKMKTYAGLYMEESNRRKVLDFFEYKNLNSILKNINDQAAIEYCQFFNGERTWFRMEIHLISQENGAAKNIILAFRNVTEDRKRELEQLHEEEKAKEAMEEAYNAANQANAAKTEFLSRMSHDLRTPMNAIMGMSAIARKNLSDPEKLEDCLDKIEIASQHLLSLLNDVLDMSKIENGNNIFQDEPFQLRKLLEETIAIIGIQANEKNQKLEVRIQELIHEEVESDRSRLQQILLNLLSNAVKYTPEGGHVLLEIRESLMSSGNVGCYHFLVADNGIGMTEEFQEKIFLPFERAPDKRALAVPGTGLGMAITQNLVNLLNGSIQVESRLNEGSRFFVTVYLKFANKKDDDIQNPAEDDENTALQKKYRILLVEDNDLNQEIAKEILESEGMTVEVAQNGREALEKFRSLPENYYHLILMDIQMPVMNGYEAAKAIRSLSRKDAGSIPIIALSANAFADDIYQAKEAGMNEHLAKPLEVRTMMNIIRKWLD